MCPGQIRGGRIKIKSPAGQKCMSHGQLYSGPRAIISVRGRKYVSHGRLFWPAGDYFGPRAIILARGRKMTKPTQDTLSSRTALGLMRHTSKSILHTTPTRVFIARVLSHRHVKSRQSFYPPLQYPEKVFLTVKFRHHQPRILKNQYINAIKHQLSMAQDTFSRARTRPKG